MFQNLSRFRGDGQLCDVRIHIQQQTFHVHRLVLAATCEFFEAMFLNNFQESRSPDITLHEVDVVAFQAILDCIYSGQVPQINPGNVYNLFTTAQYLGNRQVVDACEEYLIGNMSHPPMNLFEIFSLTFRTDITGRVKDEIIKCIQLNFKKLIQHEQFMDVPYDDLNSLLEIYRTPRNSRFKDEKFLSNALLRWINHRPQERTKHFKSFAEAGHFDESSTVDEPFLANGDVPNQEAYVDSLNDTPTIQVFQQHGSQQTGHSFKIFSLKNDRVVPQWFVSFKHEGGEQIDDRRILTFTTFKDAFYCFKSEWDGTSRKTLPLYSYSSLKFTSESPTRVLAEFPVDYNFHDGPQLCGFGDNTIYFYAKPYGAAYFKNTRAEGFSEEELGRGIYCYNYSANRWLPVPRMNYELQRSRLVTTNHLVYLIGGSQYGFASNIAGYVHQAYDPRSPHWLTLRRSSYQYEWTPFVGMVNGRVYVYNDKKMEAYDQRAGRWETIDPGFALPNGELICEERKEKLVQFMSFEDKLYFFYHRNYGRQKYFRSYDPGTGKLFRAKSLTNVGHIENFAECFGNNMVIF